MDGSTTSYTYNRFGQVLTETDALGQSETNTYSPLGRLETSTDRSGLTTEYTHDALGRVTATAAGTAHADTLSRSYTKTGQLLREERGWQRTDYAYDGRGNRSQMTVTGTDRYTVQYTYDANNRLTQEEKTRGIQTGLTTYTYDPNGNLTQRMELGCDGSPSAASFTYDVFGQQATATYNGATTAYTYNAQGIRVAKTTAGSRTDFLLDGGNVAAEETNGDITTYLRGVNLIARSDGETTEYYLYNAHGDVVQRTDSSGAVTKAYIYDAFGVEQNPDSTDPNPFRYCGEYFDRETGTYYLRARYYSPETGRFTQEDPSCDGLNWYVYCSGNPIMLADPSGLKDIAVRSTIEALGGTVKWDERTNTAIIYLDGKYGRIYAGDQNGSYIDKSGKMHTDDTWLFAALGSTFDLGGGWTGRIERGTSGKNYQRHVHVYKGEKAWSQNEDGSPHDDGNNSSGAPPKSVLKSLNKKKGWDWTRKENDWLNKIETQYGDSGYTAIIYPNGRRVTVFKQPGWYTRPYFPTKQEFRDYYYGPTYINFGSESITTASFPFLPLPGPISFPVPFPAPLPVW